MRLSTGLISAALTVALAGPSSSYALTAQQQLMADCQHQAGEMRGQARKVFLQQCLSKCSTGKRCGNSCIAANEVCHK